MRALACPDPHIRLNSMNPAGFRGAISIFMEDRMGLLDGKTGLILNIANDRSIATHIATNCVKQGAKCGFGFLPMGGNTEKSERRVRKAMEENGYADSW